MNLEILTPEKNFTAGMFMVFSYQVQQAHLKCLKNMPRW